MYIVFIINVLNHKSDKLSFKPLQLKFPLEIHIFSIGVLKIRHFFKTTRFSIPVLLIFMRGAMYCICVWKSCRPIKVREDINSIAVHFLKKETKDFTLKRKFMFTYSGGTYNNNILFGYKTKYNL